LTENEPFQDGVDIVMPALEGDDAAVGEDDDGPVRRPRDSADQGDLIGGQV